MTLDELVEAALSRIRRYSPDEANAAAEHGAVIVDIRARDARERDGVIPGSYHVPRTVLEWRVASEAWRHHGLDGRRLILVCDHGYSSYGKWRIVAAGTFRSANQCESTPPVPGPVSSS